MAASSSGSTRWVSATRPRPPAMPAKTTSSLPSQPSKRWSRPTNPATSSSPGSRSVLHWSARSRPVTGRRGAAAASSTPSIERDLDAGDGEAAGLEEAVGVGGGHDVGRSARRRRRRTGRPSTLVPGLDDAEGDGAGVVGDVSRSMSATSARVTGVRPSSRSSSSPPPSRRNAATAATTTRPRPPIEQAGVRLLLRRRRGGRRRRLVLARRVGRTRSGPITVIGVIGSPRVTSACWRARPNASALDQRAAGSFCMARSMASMTGSGTPVP